MKAFHAPAALAVSAALYLSCASAGAQPVSERIYEIELIVFEHIQPGPDDVPDPLIEPPPEQGAEPAPENVFGDFVAPEPTGSGALPPEPQTEPDPADASTTTLPTDGDESDALEPPPPPLFLRTDDEALQLKPLYQRLRRSSGFRPLLHVGWRELATTAAAAEPFTIVYPPPPEPDVGAARPETLRAGPQRTPAGSPHDELSKLPGDEETLSGSVTLRLERFLHADLALALRPDGVQSSYELRQSRRVGNDQLQYFDHPRFGVLLHVTALSEPDSPLLPPRVVSPEAEPEEAPELDPFRQIDEL